MVETVQELNIAAGSCALGFGSLARQELCDLLFLNFSLPERCPRASRSHGPCGLFQKGSARGKCLGLRLRLSSKCGASGLSLGAHVSGSCARHPQHRRSW